MNSVHLLIYIGKFYCKLKPNPPYQAVVSIEVVSAKATVVVCGAYYTHADRVPLQSEGLVFNSLSVSRQDTVVG